MDMVGTNVLLVVVQGCIFLFQAILAFLVMIVLCCIKCGGGLSLPSCCFYLFFCPQAFMLFLWLSYLLCRSWFLSPCVGHVFLAFMLFIVLLTFVLLLAFKCLGSSQLSYFMLLLVFMTFVVLSLWLSSCPSP